MIRRVGIDVVGDPSLELRCGQRADLAGDLAAVAPHDQGGDPLDTEPACDRGGFVDVDLDGLEAAGEAPADVFDGGTDRSAWTAPRRPTDRPAPPSWCLPPRRSCRRWRRPPRAAAGDTTRRSESLWRRRARDCVSRSYRTPRSSRKPDHPPTSLTPDSPHRTPGGSSRLCPGPTRPWSDPAWWRVIDGGLCGPCAASEG